ncbi:hypothetical protein EHM92_07155, partial [bacterium]
MAVPSFSGTTAVMAPLSDRQPVVPSEGFDPAHSRGEAAMKTRMLMYSPLLLLLMTSESLSGGASHGGRSAFTLLARTPDHWTVEYTPGVFSRLPVSISGQTYQSFGIDAASSMTAAGAPQLPVEVLTLGIPWGSKLQAALVDPVYEDQAGVLVAPCPAYTIDEKRQTTASFMVDNATYSQDRFLPLQPLVVDQPFTLRQQRVSTIRIAPYLYNPSSRLLRRLVKGRLEIALVRDGSIGEEEISSNGAKGPDPWFEDMYKSLLWNYQEAKSWRGEAPLRATSDPTRDWFTAGQKYHRIPVAADGWYRLTLQDLSTAGATTADLSTLQLFHRGKEIPVLVLGDSTIGFYGLRNHGDSTYDDFYTDTSAFWLTAGSREGLRYVPSSTAPGGTPTAIHASLATIHREENTDYYEGTGESEITRNGLTPGEGWVWEYYYPGTSLTHTFMLDSIDAGQGMAAVRVRMYGTTLHAITPDHRAQIWINDSLAGEIGFDGREGVIFSSSVPGSWLVTGANRLRIASIPTANGINQFYLDWFEIDYPRVLRAVNGQITFTLDPRDPTRALVTGLPNPNVKVADISTGRLIQSFVVGGDSITGFSVTFDDTASSSRTYAVFVQGSELPASIKSGKAFADLRANATGADYIIVTHGDFLAPAQSLASERRSFNGVRTAVADVQDIYDEFNYGHPSAHAIKAYLKNAYATWPSPAPAYLLLLGDASWDSHRYMKSSTRVNYVPAYGVPAGDNWYGCFDAADSLISSLFIGRVCVQ